MNHSFYNISKMLYMTNKHNTCRIPHQIQQDNQILPAQCRMNCFPVTENCFLFAFDNFTFVTDASFTINARIPIDYKPDRYEYPQYFIPLIANGTPYIQDEHYLYKYLFSKVEKVDIQSTTLTSIRLSLVDNALTMGARS